MNSPSPYSPIDGKNHLRVLLLEPAENRDADLIGSLQHTTLREQDEELIEPYTAISYVWGNPTPVDKILLDGHEIGITESLGAALRGIRDATRAHRVWADAICINQRNVEERNQQVAIMGQIYSFANNTIIYLGPLESHSELVLRAVQEAAVYQDSYTSDMTDARPLEIPPDAPYDIETVVSEAENGLLFRPWFRRIWVLQELVLSRKPWVQCGTKRVRWRDFCRFLITLLESCRSEAELKNEAGSGSRYHVKSMNGIRAEYIKYRVHPPHHSAESDVEAAVRERFSLAEILKMRIGCRMADPRDAIFAHLGIISDRDRVLKFVKLDYSQTIRELLTAAARSIDQEGNLKRLLEGITPSHPLRSILPSWVPDWRIDVSQESLQKELEAISETALHDSAYIASFDIMESWEILDVSGVLPLPSIYPSEWWKNWASPYGTDDWTQHLWGEFLNAGEAVSDEGNTRRLASLESWLDELRRLQSRLRGLEKTTPWGSIASTIIKYLRIAQPESYQLALISRGTLELVSHETSVGDLVARLGSRRDLNSSPERTISACPMVVTRLHPLPFAARFELDYISRYKGGPSFRGGPYEFHFQHCRLIGTGHNIHGESQRFDGTKDLLDLSKNWAVHDYRREGQGGNTVPIMTLR
ncbi:heterokaryon incompatibility protein-domain-containing protein [Nemania serpens]|nr:heterokaryon incompatibility protein-domain-containing protein [Nemania serpens]